MDYGKLALKRIEELYMEIYGMRKEMTKSVGSVSTSLTGEGRAVYSAELSFRSGEGDAVLTLFLNGSVNTVAEVYVDGELLGAFACLSGGSQKEIELGSLSSGVHTVKVRAVGDEEYILTSCSLTVTGNVYMGDGDVFIEGFSGCNAYIRLTLGRLEVFTFENGKSTLQATLYGIKSARTAFCGEKILLVVTECGVAYVIDFTNGYDNPACFYVAQNAVSACGVNVDDRVEIFVSTGKVVENYKYIPQSKIEGGGRVNVVGEDLLALYADGRIYLITKKGGYISIDVERESKPLSLTDTFSLLLTKGV